MNRRHTTLPPVAPAKVSIAGSNGSGVNPLATGNPTLTLAALALWAAETLLTDLG